MQLKGSYFTLFNRRRGLISHVRVMFSSVWTSQTSEKNETILVRSILNYFPHTVSKNYLTAQLNDNILSKQNVSPGLLTSPA